MRNILHITPDQMRHDVLGCKGVFPVQTPNLDTLAANGVMFDRAYCTNPLCAPSRTSIMTGRFCYDHGVYYNGMPVPEEAETLQGILRRNGYYTISVGKMHFLPRSAHYGFHKRVADGHQYAAYLQNRGLTRERHDTDPDEEDPIRRHYLSGPTTLPMEHYMPAYRARRAMEELERIAQTRDATPEGCEPFYMWLSFSKPHSACDQPEPYFSMYDPNDVPPPVTDPSEKPDAPTALKKFARSWASFTEDELQQIRAQYLGSVSLVDHLIGQLMDKLRELGLDDNTLVVIDSDHGDHLGDHNQQQKGFFYESAARTPFIFAGPGVQSGKVIEENVTLADIVPTLLDYCDLRLPERYDADGTPLFEPFPPDAQSLLPVLQGEADVDPHRLIVAESGIHGLHLMLLRNRRKLNYYQSDERFELYDLDEDPQEIHDKGAELNRARLPEAFAADFPVYLKKALAHEGRQYLHQRTKAMRMFEWSSVHETWGTREHP